MTICYGLPSEIISFSFLFEAILILLVSDSCKITVLSFRENINVKSKCKLRKCFVCAPTLSEFCVKPMFFIH